LRLKQEAEDLTKKVAYEQIKIGDDVWWKEIC
jgi:hypothetical protein